MTEVFTPVFCILTSFFAQTFTWQNMHTPVVHLPNHCEPVVGASSKRQTRFPGWRMLMDKICSCFFFWGRKISKNNLFDWTGGKIAFSFCFFRLFFGFCPMSVHFSTSRHCRLKPRNSLGRAHFFALLEVDHHRVGYQVSNFMVNSAINYPRYHQISWISAIKSRQGWTCSKTF